MKDINRLRYDKTLSVEKRIETGSYYTPPEMAALMVSLALSNTLSRKLGILNVWEYMQLFSETSNEGVCSILEKIDETHLKKINNTLLQLTVLDLSAGSGIFPLTYMALLERWFSRFNLWHIETIQKIAQKLYVVDIQPEPLQLYIEEMVNQYAVKPIQLSVFCLDALDSNAIFNESKLGNQFLEGFDLVLGNPPYLGEKNHKELFQKLRETPFGSKYYEGRMDYFYYFIYRGIEALKPSGQLCFITTNYFATADGAKKLREYLHSGGRFNSIINFNDCALFKDALGQHNVVFVYEKANTGLQTKTWQDEENHDSCLLAYPLSKTASLQTLYNAYEGYLEDNEWSVNEISQSSLFDFRGMLKLVPSEGHQLILDQLRYNGENDRGTLGEHFYVQQGIVSGFDRDFKEKQGVFVLTNEEANNRPWLQGHLKPFYKNKQIRKYQIVKPTKYEILYLSEKQEALEQEVGPVFEHLNPYRERLSSRREVQKNIRPWYALQWPREPWRFEGPLIAAPQRAFVNVFAYEAHELYGSADIYYISDRRKDQWVEARTLWTMAYLNSPIVYFWLSLMGKRKGSMLELYATPLKSIPVPEFDETDSTHLHTVSLVQNIMALKLDEITYEQIKEDYLEQINAHFYALFKLNASEIAHIAHYYNAAGGESYEAHYWESSKTK